MLELSSLDDDDELLCCGRPVTFGSGDAGVLAVVDVAMAERLGASQLRAWASTNPSVDRPPRPQERVAFDIALRSFMRRLAAPVQGAPRRGRARPRAAPAKGSRTRACWLAHLVRVRTSEQAQASLAGQPSERPAPRPSASDRGGTRGHSRWTERVSSEPRDGRGVSSGQNSESRTAAARLDLSEPPPQVSCA